MPDLTQSELLKAAGKCLYGEHGDNWKQLRYDLGVGERNWLKFLNGTRPIPKGVWDELFLKLSARSNRCSVAAELIISNAPHLSH